MANKIHSPAYVYRHYDRNGILLYVGFTRNPKKRTDQHRYYSGWWEYVVETVIEECAWWYAASQREKEIIQEEYPVFNIMHKRKIKATEVWQAASRKQK